MQVVVGETLELDPDELEDDVIRVDDGTQVLVGEVAILLELDSDVDDEMGNNSH